MQSCDFQLRRLASAQDPLFEQLLDIYMEANAPGERKSLEWLDAMLQQPAYYFLAGMNSESMVGYAILRTLDECDGALLEYFAVARDCRGQGVGTALLAKTKNLDAFRAKFLLAEVGSDKKPDADRAEKTRRKSFYRRMGWREVDHLNYIMPPVSSALPPPMDMLVYALALPSFLERDRVRQWLQRCYVEVYGQSADDPRIDAMVAGLPAQLRLI